MPSHVHQAKRPYAGSHSQSQSTITNYFSLSPSTPHTVAPPPTQPSPPHPVQSSLLSVGMRIRKSVPEGYKTGTPYSGFSLFSDSNTPNSSSIITPKYKGARPRAGMRELTPFCGLMKTGGLGVQGQGWDYSNGGEVIEDGDDEDDGDWWESSQESMRSVGSYGRGNAAKRRFLDDGEGEEPNDENGRVLIDSGFGGRKIAVPRTRKAAKGETERSSMGGDENASMDFGEAEFLDYAVAEEEVQMGGL